MSRPIHLGRLLGRKVCDPSGQSAGRIEEVHAHRTADGECVIDEYILGRRGLMERLSIPIVRLFISRPRKPGYKVPWGEMDLCDPKHPKIRCAADELEKAE